VAVEGQSSPRRSDRRTTVLAMQRIARADPTEWRRQLSEEGDGQTLDPALSPGDRSSAHGRALVLVAVQNGQPHPTAAP